MKTRIHLKLKKIESDRNIINEIISNKNQQNYIPHPSYQEAEQAEQEQSYGLYCWNQAIQQKYKCRAYKIEVNSDFIILSNEQQTITIKDDFKDKNCTLTKEYIMNNPQYLEKIIVAACKLQLTSKNKENIEETTIDGLTLKSEYVSTEKKVDFETPKKPEDSHSVTKDDEEKQLLAQRHLNALEKRKKIENVELRIS